MQPTPDAALSVLVVSYTFLPVGEVGAKRIGKFCRYLPETGIRPVVLTAQERFYQFQDRSVPPPEGIRLVRTTVWPTPLDLYTRLRRARAPQNFRAATRTGRSPSEAPQTEEPRGLLKSHLLALFQMPDPYWGWYLPAVREGSRLIREEQIAAILSTGPPWISHLVARRLKTKHKLPWLADFRDPWANNPSLEDPVAWRRKVKQRMEASCFRSADRVICNTERLQQFFANAYPALPQEKFVVLSNGFDNAAQPRCLERDTRRLFLHIGSLYVQRRVDTFCEAMSMLVKTGRLLRGSFQVVFLGDTEPALAAAARERAPELFADGSLEFRPRVGWTEAQNLVWQADYLLLFQGHLRLEVPAKFFEYLPTGKPMFAAVKQGALTDIVQATGCGVSADPDDPDDIARQLERLLEWPVLSPEEVQRKWYSQYHCRALTARLAEWIRNVVRTGDDA